MRKQKLWVSWLELSLVCLLFFCTIIAAFVPIKFSSGEYYSFFGAQTYSSDLSDKLVVTYSYKSTSNTDKSSVDDACKTIEKILHNKGYASAIVTALGSDQIKVEMAKPDRGDQLQDAFSLLGNQGIGVGNFELKTENTADAEPLLTGSEHIKKISIVSNSGYYYTVVEFTTEGKSLLNNFQSVAESEGKSVSYYLYFGGSSEITGGYAFTPSSNFVNGDLYIGGFEDIEYAEQYKLMLDIGSLKINLNSATALDINSENNITKNFSRIMLWSVSLFFIVMFILVIGIRHGLFAFVVSLINNVFIVALILLLSIAMRWVELSSIGLITWAICLSVFNLCLLFMFEKMRHEKQIGKDLSMSIDSGYMKSLLPTIGIGVLMFFIGLFCAVAFEGQIRVISTIISMFGVLTIFFVLCCAKGIFNWLIKVGRVNKRTISWGADNND